MRVEGIVMGIYPNSIGFGFAIMKSPKEIVDCGVHKVSPISNLKCLKRVKKLLDYYQPAILILSDPKGSQKSRVKELIESILVEARKSRLSVLQYTRNQIGFVFKEFGAKTKFEIAEVLSEWFPEVAYRKPKFRKPWMREDYNMGLFDALSLVICDKYLTS